MPSRIIQSFKKKRLVLATIVYWILLLYIIVALVWWYIALERQSQQMTTYRMNELLPSDPAYIIKKQKILDEKKNETTQYIGEGATFLALILVGAVFVYRAVLRQINLQQQQQNFMMAITHELKTPIAVTKLNLETLLRHQLDEPTRQKLVSMTLQEANRLNTLASNILVSAQLEDQNYQQAKEDLDFSSLVNNCIENYAVRYPVGKFLFEIEPEIDLSGDVLLLQILVNNLIENALKYSPPESPIVCRLTAKKEIIFQVIDNGPGIPDHEKKNIFRKFYRLGNEQTRNAKGTGIGLYLCRKIAQDHHAEIKVRDHHPTGSDFAVIFIRS